MSKLKQQLIRLGNTNPDLRSHLRPILDTIVKNASYRTPSNVMRSLDEAIRDRKPLAKRDTFHKEVLETLEALKEDLEMGVTPYTRFDTIIREEIPLVVWDFVRKVHAEDQEKHLR